MSQCLFCKIIEGKIVAEKVFENENIMAFKDINPVAPIHLLFIHKKHTKDISDLISSDPEQILQIFDAINLYSKNEKIDLNGFRLINNMGRDGGQSVFHTHFHFLAGKELRWEKQ